MQSDAADNADAGPAAQGLGEGRRRVGAGLVVSVVLHGLALSALIVVLEVAAKPNNAPLVIPVNIVRLAEETAAPIEPNQADVPQQKTATPSSPAAQPVELSAAEKHPPPDELEIKLRNLAQLRQPTVDTRLSQQGEGLSRVAAMPENAALGSDATIKDFLRDQIEHHWSPNLAALHGRNISVLIRVAITNAGIVTKADIVNNPEFGVDPAYDEIAFSARNAALLSSPLTLPPGHYAQSMDLILSLDTRDALR
jgi:outer membrane biosynthesis protein TonB